MTPARKAKLQTAIELIESTEAHRRQRTGYAAINAMVGMGALYRRGDPHVLRFAGITASCTWHDGHPLLASWLKKAKAALRQQQAAA